MSWADCVGPGWRSIVEPLIERAEREGVAIHQVKEKFGGLRFYVGAASDEFHAAIDEAARKSVETCEECGEPGHPRDLPWIRTLCDKHFDRI